MRQFFAVACLLTFSFCVVGCGTGVDNSTAVPKGDIGTETKKDQITEKNKSDASVSAPTGGVPAPGN